MSEHLGCAHCPFVIEVSEEDPDATLSDAVDHQRMRHGQMDWRVAMQSIEELTR